MLQYSRVFFVVRIFLPLLVNGKFESLMASVTSGLLPQCYPFCSAKEQAFRAFRALPSALWKIHAMGEGKRHEIKLCFIISPVGSYA